MRLHLVARIKEVMMITLPDVDRFCTLSALESVIVFVNKGVSMKTKIVSTFATMSSTGTFGIVLSSLCILLCSLALVLEHI